MALAAGSRQVAATVAELGDNVRATRFLELVLERLADRSMSAAVHDATDLLLRDSSQKRSASGLGTARHHRHPVEGQRAEPMDSVVAVASGGPPSPDDYLAGRRAIELVGQHWVELTRLHEPRLARPGIQRGRRLAQQIAVVMMVRYGNGHGDLVEHLRRHPDAGRRRQSGSS